MREKSTSVTGSAEALGGASGECAAGCEAFARKRIGQRGPKNVCIRARLCRCEDNVTWMHVH